MNTEDQTLQIREARQEPQYKNRNAGPVQNATMWFVKCWAWEKKWSGNTSATTFVTSIWFYTCCPHGNSWRSVQWWHCASTIKCSDLCLMITVIWVGSTNKVAPCSYFQKRVNIEWSRWRDLLANPPSWGRPCPEKPPIHRPYYEFHFTSTSRRHGRRNTKKMRLKNCSNALHFLDLPSRDMRLQLLCIHSWFNYSIALTLLKLTLLGSCLALNYFASIQKSAVRE